MRSELDALAHAHRTAAPKLVLAGSIGTIVVLTMGQLLIQLVTGPPPQGALLHVALGTWALVIAAVAGVGGLLGLLGSEERPGSGQRAFRVERALWIVAGSSTIVFWVLAVGLIVLLVRAQ